MATNALLEGSGARTALVATEGFEDVVELGRQARADLYRLCAAHPAPLVPPERRVGAPERMTPDGPLRRSRTPAARRGARSRRCEPEAVAVCLLHAYRHPGARAGARRRRCASGCPDVHVSLSHEVVGTFREYERAATTELDAALSPLLAAYLAALAGAGARPRACPRPDVMQSSGGLADARRRRARTPRSPCSPAPPAAPPARPGRRSRPGSRDALCFDMGGTSCDVCVIEDGAVREAAGRPVGGRPVALPMLDLHTVGAGGGSIAWRDAGGALRVGPQLGRRASRARRPTATAATEPTVTDANLVLGLLGTDARSRARSRSTRAAAERGGRRARRASSGSSRASAPRGSSASPTPRWSARCA